MNINPWVNGKPAGDATATPHFDLGPRGLCMLTDARSIWCKGAVPSPRQLTASAVRVSPGEDASACATTTDGRLYCWGEAYASGARPVRVLFEDFPAPPPNPNPAPVDLGPPGEGEPPWGKSCLINKSCEVVAQVLPACAAGGEALDWSKLAPEKLSGSVAVVRGTLGLGQWLHTRIGCREVDPVTQKRLDVTACCNRANAPVVVNVADGVALVVDGYSCVGDESRLCCNVPVQGQRVIATGKLTPADGVIFKWNLTGVRLCVATP
jgi:hypothetical protein